VGFRSTGGQIGRDEIVHASKALTSRVQTEGVSMIVDRRSLLVGGGAFALAGATKPTAQPLDPWVFTARHASGRKTEYRVLAPDTPGLWPVVLFSHGANSSNQAYDRLLAAWAARGLLVVAPSHLDSGGPPDPNRLPPEGLWPTRVADLRLPLDQRESLDTLAKRQGARINWSRVAAAGHSFGAVVAQALAGARLTDPKTNAPFDGADARVCAVATFSPPGPRAALVPSDAWDSVTAPALLQTGDADRLPGFVDDWRQHKAGFDPLPGCERWLLVGSGVDHYFGGLICRLKDDPVARAQASALAATARISGDFLCAHLASDRTAERRLSHAAKTGSDAPILALSRV
jgi:dienelactone hydrolase